MSECVLDFEPPSPVLNPFPFSARLPARRHTSHQTTSSDSTVSHLQPCNRPASQIAGSALPLPAPSLLVLVSAPNTGPQSLGEPLLVCSGLSCEEGGGWSHRGSLSTRLREGGGREGREGRPGGVDWRTTKRVLQENLESHIAPGRSGI